MKTQFNTSYLPQKYKLDSEHNVHSFNYTPTSCKIVKILNLYGKYVVSVHFRTLGRSHSLNTSAINTGHYANEDIQSEIIYENPLDYSFNNKYSTDNSENFQRTIQFLKVGDSFRY